VAEKNKTASMPKKAATAPDREFVISRILDAPRELVFQAWTDPKHMATWWGPQNFSNPVCELDPRTGGKWFIQMRGADGVDHPCQGVYREIVAPERIVMTIDHSCLPEEWHDMVNPSRDKSQGRPALEGIATVSFEEHHGQTKLIVRILYESVAIRDSLLKLGMHEGWAQSLDKLAAEVAVTGGPLVIERTLNAPVSVVWRALTDNAAIKKWYFDLDDFQPRVGFEFQFTGEDKGVTYLHHCKITEVIPEKKIAYTWRYENFDGSSLVTFEVAADGDKTRLTLTHVGLETFPKLPSFARANFTMGWTHIIGTSLKGRVEQNGVNATHGKHEADTADREIVISRVLDAPRELVWDAWTDPEQVAKWWGPRGFTTTIHEMDVRPGGVWSHTMHGPDDTDYPNKSVFVEVVKPERIVYKHAGGRVGSEGANFESTWTFEALGDKTKLTIRMVFPTAEQRDRVVKEFGAIEGGKQTLERLAEFLAQK
jgi:uncharacterized protein YndB with AHSA1/START domain